MMQGFYDRIALVYFTLATLFLMRWRCCCSAARSGR